MRTLLVTTAVAVGALAGPALASTGTWTVTGSGTGSGAVAGDRLQLAVRGDAPDGPVTGAVENEFTLVTSHFVDGGEPVCLRVDDRKAVVVYRLRAPVSVPELPGKVFAYGAAYVEDNGDPVAGEPVDRMLDFAVQESNVHFFCDADPATFFDAALAEPLAAGNFVIGAA